MPGVGTLIDMSGIIAGGATALAFGRLFSDRMKNMMMTVCGISVFVVSFCAMDEGYTEGDDWALNIKSVIIFGKASFIEFAEEPEKVREICVGLSAKFTDDPNYADDEIAKVGKNVLCIEITPDHMTGKLVNEA